MHDDVLVPDRLEAVAAELADPLRNPRLMGREPQVRPLVDDHLRRIGKAQAARLRKHVPRVDAEPLGHQPQQVGRHVCVAGQADHLAAPAPLQGGLEGADQVLGLAVDLHLAVPDDPKQAPRRHLQAGEQGIEIETQHVLQRQPPDRLARQADEARHLHRQRQQRLQALTLAAQPQHHGDTAIGEERERLRRIDGQRRQHRQHLVAKIAIEPPALVAAELVRRHQGDAGLAQALRQQPETTLLLVHLRAGQALDFVQLLRRGQAVLAGRADPRRHLTPEAGDADHVEFV